MPVYFIQDEIGEIKIGYSEGNPYGRLRTFQTGNPRKLTMLVSIPGGLAEEQALHARFADLRGNGEWFKPDARMLGFIEGMKYAYRDQQPKPEDAEPAKYGFTTDQIAFLLGVIRGSTTISSVRAVVEELDAVDEAGDIREVELSAAHVVELSRLTEFAEDAAKLYHEGRAFGQGFYWLSAEYDVARARELLAQHFDRLGYAEAEARLVADDRDGVTPVEIVDDPSFEAFS